MTIDPNDELSYRLLDGSAAVRMNAVFVRALAEDRVTPEEFDREVMRTMVGTREGDWNAVLAALPPSLESGLRTYAVQLLVNEDVRTLSHAYVWPHDDEIGQTKMVNVVRSILMKFTRHFPAAT